ncbi:MAG: DUF3857 domain-containing protein [Bernardetiaceae bacterium]|nr:DUF3857 domain-containing protein [Bernardetiaceae bacterium]
MLAPPTRLQNAFKPASLLLILALFGLRSRAALMSTGGSGASRGDDPMRTYMYEHERYNWQQRHYCLPAQGPELYHAAFILKDKRAVEYIYDGNENLKIYETVHKIVRVNTAEAVQQYSKVYLPMSGVTEVIMLKARFVGANGRVVELSEEEIKDLENPQNAGAFKIFAVSGAERGGEIEYLYTVAREAQYFGREIFQSENEAHNVEFEIISPNNLLFEAKSYNGFPELRLWENRYPGKNSLLVRASHLPALAREPLSFHSPNLMRVDYKLAYDHIEGSNRLHTWNHAAEAVMNNIYLQELADSELTQLNETLKYIFKGVAANNDARITAIERYLKQNIRLDADTYKHHDQVLDVLNTRYAGKTDLVRLYALMFMFADVEHEVVLTTDRTQTRFDGDFESWYALSNYLFYFPQSGRYLAPHDLSYTYGPAPYQYTHNPGLFISLYQQGSETQLASEVREILPPSATHNLDKTLLAVDLGRNLEQPEAKMVRQFTGYHAVPLRYANQLINGNERTEVFADLITRQIPGAQVRDFAIRDSRAQTDEETVELRASLTLPLLIEKAKDRLLLRPGHLLGENLALPAVANRARANRLEQEFGHETHQVLEFTLPSGYTVANLEALAQHRSVEVGGKTLAAFTVKADLVGDKLQVKISEVYHQAVYDKELVPQFAALAEAKLQFARTALVLKK